MATVERRSSLVRPTARNSVRYCPGCYMLPVDLCRTTGAPWRGQVDHVCTSFPKPQGRMNEGWVTVEAWMTLCRAAHFSAALPCARPTQVACCRQRGNDQGPIAHWVGTRACPQGMPSALRRCILGMHHPKQATSPAGLRLAGAEVPWGCGAQAAGSTASTCDQPLHQRSQCTHTAPWVAESGAGAVLWAELAPWGSLCFVVARQTGS